MKGAGSAMMGIGIAAGDNRAADAATEAISSRLLESSIEGATRVLLSIAGNKDLGIQEINEAADLVAKNVDPDANIIFGTTLAITTPSKSSNFKFLSIKKLRIITYNSSSVLVLSVAILQECIIL